jgi:hypothetical protein
VVQTGRCDECDARNTPSGRFRTQPATPTESAHRRIVSRKKTSRTKPLMQARRRLTVVDLKG